MRAAGYTAVGEFHYLGFEQALAAAEAAEAAGHRRSSSSTPRMREAGSTASAKPLRTEYLNQVENLRGRGIEVGVAPHSVRACPPDWLEQIGRYAAENELPLHVHADEQPREIDECVEEHGIRPIELLAKTGCLGPRTTIVHATHADDAELDLVAQANARICVCPTTEANLGDGFLPVEKLCERSIGMCIGSDSNVRIDPLEELRELEGIARRRTLRRNVISPDTLLCFGVGRGRRLARPRVLARRGGRPRPSVARRSRRGRRVRSPRLRLLGRRLRLENRPAERAHGELHCDTRGRVLVIVDRIDLDDVQRVHHARLCNELEGEMRLAVREPAAHGIPHAGRDLGIDDVEVDRNVHEWPPVTRWSASVITDSIPRRSRSLIV